MKSPFPFQVERDLPSSVSPPYGGPRFRVLVFAPSANDARLTVGFLETAGLSGLGCANFSDLTQEMSIGCGVLVVADETLMYGTQELADLLSRQPPWSDLPIIIVTSAHEDHRLEMGIDTFASAAGNVTVLERPFRPDTLLSSIKVALRARRRQYEVRDLLQKLQNGEVRVRGILDSISDGFMTVDSSWRITYVNAAYMQLIAPLFLRHEDLVGQILWDKFPDLSDSPIGALYRRVMAGEQQQTLEIFYEPLQAWLEIRAFPSAQALSLYTRNITARKKTEEALREAKEKAEATSRSKDHFLAVLSHELRTPLTPVLMITSALEREDSLPEGIKQDMAMIRRNVELETKLIDDLLDLSRITTGKLHLHFQCVRVNEMVRQVCEICRSQIEDQGLSLDLKLGPKVDGVKADVARFQQILWNVVKNAAKFTPRGGHIVISTRVEDTDRVVIEIADTGIGIHADNIEKIFDAFEQGDARRTQQFGGLGLGLAITKALVALHDGHIEVRSDGPGSGTVFTITLPSLAVQQLVPSVSGVQPRHGDHRSILLVEDHEDTAVVLRRLLIQRGYHVTIATSVAEARTKAGDLHFDILVSDIGLPDATGYELVKSLKQTYTFQGIAMSGYGMEEDIRKSLDAGFAKHLVKPVNIAALEDAIQGLSSAD